MIKSRYELREFANRKTTRQEASDIAGLHVALLSHSPLVLMGKHFMRDFYYTVLPKSGLICGAIAYVDDRPAGFIVGTDDPQHFMSKAVARSFFRLVWVVFMSLLRKPKRLRAMMEAYSIQSNVQAIGYESGTGELLSFGVLPEFRSREFLSQTNLHIASELMECAVEQLAQSGVTTIRAIVDTDNFEAQIYYRNHGWQVGQKSVKGWNVPTMEFVRDIDRVNTGQRE